MKINKEEKNANGNSNQILVQANVKSKFLKQKDPYTSDFTVVQKLHVTIAAIPKKHFQTIFLKSIQNQLELHLPMTNMKKLQVLKTA